MTNHRADAFRKSYQNLQLWPLVTPEKIRDFRVEYGQDLLEQLTQLVEDCSPNNNKIIFTGHRGSGKSTLLGKFSQEMENKFFVVLFSIADLIEGSDVNHVNILFAMAVILMEKAETQHIEIGNKTKQAFYEWFSKHTKIEPVFASNSSRSMFNSTPRLGFLFSSLEKIIPFTSSFSGNEMVSVLLSCSPAASSLSF